MEFSAKFYAVFQKKDGESNMQMMIALIATPITVVIAAVIVGLLRFYQTVNDVTKTLHLAKISQRVFIYSE